MKRVLILHGDSSPEVGKMFILRGYHITFDESAWDDISLVCFTGGADVSPYLYGEENTSSYCDLDRDLREIDTYDRAREYGIPMVGICRGGQFLNVMNGGKMIQHLGMTVSGMISMEVNVGSDVPLERIEVKVDHHQGIIQAPHGINSGFIRLDDVEIAADYIVYYPDTRSLCFQPHPEWGHQGTEELFFDRLKTTIGL